MLVELLLFSSVLLSCICNGNAGVTSAFVRNEWPSVDIALDDQAIAVPKGYNAPQQHLPSQVHITQGDYDGKAVIVSWITADEPGSNKVQYGLSDGKYHFTAEGIMQKYTFYNYTSGYIHHCLLDDLQYDTKYYYEVEAGNSSRGFWFRTPPPIDLDAPYRFGIIGDLGQTYNSLSTLEHSLQLDAETILYVGDLSYADRGRLFLSEIMFTDTLLLIILVEAVIPSVKYTPQWSWLKEEFERVDRVKTPWLIVLMHALMYNSYTSHFMEGESMRVVFENWFCRYKVDVVFAGHVHAYERSYRVSNIKYNVSSGTSYAAPDKSAPVYITVGDGGNKGGLATSFKYPQPNYCAFREASYGHSTLEIKNRTHALYHWNRNDDGKRVPTDQMVLHNQYWRSNGGRRAKRKINLHSN
ncbi:hypothetical protein SASPL_109630 [Salvia splendens]|uniref:Purple acid phosphatase n=1 Tax=Salvia splendens TaxID=180675 RepID=A0A8X8YKE0_SALSN|nr:hypothetical protein SASPL_109630 [Salvia splendens]